MAVKIRLQRKGRKKAPFYFLVVADSRSPRDGRCIERIGSYNPVPKLALVDVDIDRAIYWLSQGAEPTKTVRSILSKQGVLFKKHLLRGVKMGIFTAEEAEEKFAQYIKEKAEKIDRKASELKAGDEKLIKARLAEEAKISEQRSKELMARKQAELNKLRSEISKNAEADDADDADDVQEVVEEAVTVEPQVQITEEPEIVETSDEVVAVAEETVVMEEPQASEEVAPETSEEEQDKEEKEKE